MHIWRWMPKLHAYIIRPLSIRQGSNSMCGDGGPGMLALGVSRTRFSKSLVLLATIAASTWWFPRQFLLLNGFMFRFHVETVKVACSFPVSMISWCSCPCTQLLQWQKQRSNAGILANRTWKWFEETFGGLKLTEMAQQQVAKLLMISEDITQRPSVINLKFQSKQKNYLSQKKPDFPLPWATLSYLSEGLASLSSHRRLGDVLSLA